MEARHPFDGKHAFQREESTVYQLMHHGWYKGKEQFCNRVWFSVYVDSKSGLDRNEVAATIERSVNSHQLLVDALKNLNSLYVNAWDTTDGGLHFSPESVEKFEKAHEEARAALDAAGAA